MATFCCSVPFLSLFSLVILLQLFGMNDAASIEIHPNQISEDAPEDVHISCRSDHLQEILLIQIGKKGEATLAELGPKDEISSPVKTHLPSSEVEDYVDTDLSLSNLNVSIHSPGGDQAGIYTCKVYYVDVATGIMMEDIAEGELKVTKSESLSKKVDSLENKIKALETIIKQEKIARLTDKNSISLLLNKVANLERINRDFSKRMSSQSRKHTDLELSLKKANENLLNEVKSRLSDKSYMNSVGTKVQALEGEKTDLLKRLDSLESKFSAIESDLKNTNTKLSQEMTNRKNDKATITSLTKKISTVEKVNTEQANQIKNLVVKDTTFQTKLSVVDQTNKDQSKSIKDLSHQYTKKVIPALNQLKSLKDTDLKLSRTVTDMARKYPQILKMITELKSFHAAKPKPKPNPCAQKILGLCIG